jgi:hypothetical protein
MGSDRYFASQKPLTGWPPSRWDDFRRPQLRRLPESDRSTLELERFLGDGEDGLVFKARIRGRMEPLAVKIVSRQPAFIFLVELSDNHACSDQECLTVPFQPPSTAALHSAGRSTDGGEVLGF